jgi:hypothetical protein
LEAPFQRRYEMSRYEMSQIQRSETQLVGQALARLQGR